MKPQLHAFCCVFALLTTFLLTEQASALKYLSPAQVQAAFLLPPPPPDESAQTAWEYQELLHLQNTRTPARLAQAKADADTRSVAMFRSVLGPAFHPDNLPNTKQLFKHIRAEEKDAVRMAKLYFHRNRPWATHPDLKNCNRDGDKQSSYPSGHTTMAFSMAVVLARLVPEKAQAIMEKAGQYAESRLICGQHYRRDIMAGEAYGTAIGIMLMENTDFLKKMTAAKQELIAAHITAP